MKSLPLSLRLLVPILLFALGLTACGKEAPQKAPAGAPTKTPAVAPTDAPADPPTEAPADAPPTA